MNTMRKWIGTFAALAFVLVAAPAAATGSGGDDDDDYKKYFTLAQTSPASPIPATTTSIVVTFTNYGSSSSFNSISIEGIVSSGANLTITNAVASPGGPGTLSGGGTKKVTLKGLAPVKKNQTLTVTLTVQVGVNACTNGQIAWKGYAWTGSVSSPSTAFTQKNANPTTAVSAACSYSISGTTPATIVKGTTKPLTVTVANASSSSSTITSVKLPPPAGISTAANDYPVSIAANTSADITFSATAPCGSNDAGGSWLSSVTGFTLSGGQPSTSVTGSCALKVDASPKSIVPGEPFTVAVKLTDGDGNTIPGYTGSVTLVTTGTGCTIVGTPSANAVAGLASITVSLSVDDTTTTCSLKGTATVDGKAFETTSLLLAVFDGILGCAPTTIDALNLPTTGPGVFNASAGGATAPGDIAFVAGVRGNGDDKYGGCTLINYAVYNNIPTANVGSQTDPLGNIVPEGFFSITWDTNQALNPVVAVTSTYRSEWGDAATGLPTRQTQVCTVFPCPGDPISFPAAWKPAPSCLSSLVVHASIPAGESSCLVSETWNVVPVGDPEYCTTPPPGPPPSPPVGWQPRCLQATTIAIVGKDPVFGR